MPKVPVKLTGEDGNIFNLIGLATKALRQAGEYQAANQLKTRVFSEAQDYDHALRIIMEFCDVE